METFCTLLALCEGNSSVTGDFSSQRPVTRSFYVFFICAGTNGWANHPDACDLARHYAHYRVSVMSGDHVVQRNMVSLGHIELTNRCLHALTGLFWSGWLSALRWRHDDHDGVSNHQPHHCLLNRLFGCRSKKTSKLRVTGLCAENSPGTGEFLAQMAGNAENVSIWWRHHGDDRLNDIIDIYQQWH